MPRTDFKDSLVGSYGNDDSMFLMLPKCRRLDRWVLSKIGKEDSNRNVLSLQIAKANTENRTEIKRRKARVGTDNEDD